MLLFPEGSAWCRQVAERGRYGPIPKLPGERRCRRPSGRPCRCPLESLAQGGEGLAEPLRSASVARSAAHSAACPSSMRRNSSKSSRRLGWAPAFPARGREGRFQAVGDVGAAAPAGPGPGPARHFLDGLLQDGGRDTPRSAASSRSAGRRSPGLSEPSRMRRSREEATVTGNTGDLQLGFGGLGTLLDW